MARFIHPNFEIDYQVDYSYKKDFKMHYNTCIHLLICEGCDLKKQSKQERHETIMLYMYEVKEETKIRLKKERAYESRRKVARRRRKNRRNPDALLKYCLLKSASAVVKNGGINEMPHLRLIIKPYQEFPQNILRDVPVKINCAKRRRNETENIIGKFNKAVAIKSD